MQEQLEARKDLTLKQKISWVLVLCLLCAVPLTFVLPRPKAPEKPLAALVAPKTAKAKTTKKRKGKIKMIQIVRGSTGQADPRADQCGNAPEGERQISGNGLSENPFADGWDWNATGFVTVPDLLSASGAYVITYQTNIPGSCTGGETVLRSFEFEVIAGDPPPPTTPRRRSHIAG